MPRSRYDKATILNICGPPGSEAGFVFFQFHLLAEWVRWTRLGVYGGPSPTFTRCPELCGKKPKDLICMGWYLLCPSISCMLLSLVSNIALASSTVVPTSALCPFNLFLRTRDGNSCHLSLLFPDEKEI